MTFTRTWKELQISNNVPSLINSLRWAWLVRCEIFPSRARSLASPKEPRTPLTARSKMVQDFLNRSKISRSIHKQRFHLVIRVWGTYKNASIVIFSLACGILSFSRYFHWFQSLYFWKKRIFFGSAKNETTPRPWSLATDVANIVIPFIIHESENFVPFSTARF